MGEWHSRETHCDCCGPAAFYHLSLEVLHVINIQYNTKNVVQYVCKVVILVYVHLSCAIMYRSRCSGSKFMTVEG